MKKIFLVLLSLISTLGVSQIPGVVSSGTTNRVASQITPSTIDSVSIDEVMPVSTKTPTMVLGNTDEPVTLTARAWYQGSEVDATFSWQLKDVETSAISGFTGATISELLDEGTYSVTLSGINENTKTITAIAAIDVEKPAFTEGEADITFDLLAIRNSSWTNPNPSLVTVTQGTNAVFDFNEVVHDNLKIGLKNNFTGTSTTWNGLMASDEANEVVMQNVGGQVVFTSTGSAVVMKFGDYCQHIQLNGRGVDGVPYGFKFVGRTTAGTQSQLIYQIGEFIKGFKYRAIDFDQNRGQGATDGGPALQWGTTRANGLASSACNWDNWDGAYLKIIGCRWVETWDEDIYAGHTSNAVDASGFRPYQTGDVWVISCTFNGAGRNHIQWSGTTGSLIVNNYGNNSGLEGLDGQNQAMSQNDGNRGNNYIMRNYFENCDMFLVITNGYQGTGNYYYIANVVIQRPVVLSGSPNVFVFYNVEDLASCHAVFANNTFKCPDVDVAPILIQYDDTDFIDATFGFYNNVISTGGTDQSFNPILQTVNTATTDRTGWVVSNTYRRTASESQLKLNNLWRPHDTTAPLFNAGISLSGLGLPFDGDIDGQTFNVNGGYSEGAFSGGKLFTP